LDLILDVVTSHNVIALTFTEQVTLGTSKERGTRRSLKLGKAKEDLDSWPDI
jgi:hypothetical protein